MTSSDLPLREIPGSYGLPFLGPIKDRWNFFYVQGRDEFFRSRMEEHGSTIFRANMPPGPWISSDPRVIVLLDGKSFPILFDNSKVEKRNLFTGTYMPPLSFTGGYRMCAYLDPSERKHGALKSLLFSVFTSQHKEIIPLIQTCVKDMFSKLEDQLQEKGRAAAEPPVDDFAHEFFFRLFCDGRSTSETKLGSKLPSMMGKWSIFQLAPVITMGLPKVLNPIEDFLFHAVGLPFFLVKSDYKKMYDAFYSAGTSFMDRAETLGISREEACHNLIFFAGFNAAFGIARWVPSLFKWVASGGESLHRELAEEIRTIVKSEGGVTMNAINKMALTKSVVWEALRMEPPLPYQYGRAKEDLVVESHDHKFKIKKGEMICGYQPFATKDPKIFDNAEKFIGNRFVGEEGEKLLEHVLWSNGRVMDEVTVDNKQCGGKNIVELLSRVILVEFFLRYDTFSVEIGTTLVNKTVTFLSLTKATST